MGINNEGPWWHIRDIIADNKFEGTKEEGKQYNIIKPSNQGNHS